MSEVNLLKRNFSRESYTNVIDTNFNELVSAPTSIPILELPTVDEFFEDYNSLFFLIPKTGDNSHTTLIETSTQYLGYNPASDEIQALQQEITGLRQQLLETRKQLEQIGTNTLNEVQKLSSNITS
jgi:hypothetical protein